MPTLLTPPLPHTEWPGPGQVSAILEDTPPYQWVPVLDTLLGAPLTPSLKPRAGPTPVAPASCQRLLPLPGHLRAAVSVGAAFSPGRASKGSPSPLAASDRLTNRRQTRASTRLFTAGLTGQQQAGGQWAGLRRAVCPEAGYPQLYLLNSTCVYTLVMSWYLPSGGW